MKKLHQNFRIKILVYAKYNSNINFVEITKYIYKKKLNDRMNQCCRI